jgi:V/A-type H+/Na+-transporting ATPase subunit E
MEVQVQELIDRIKKDGIDEAEAKAKAILSAAEERALKIVTEAQQKAKGVVAEAEAERARTEESGKAALEQASRNLLIAFRESVGKTLSSIVAKEVQAAYSERTLEEALPALIASWKEKGSEDLSLLVPPYELKKLEGLFRSKLASDLLKGVELKAFPGLKAGFRIVERKGEAYYDFSAEAVAEMLSQYLNASLQGIMKNAIRER